MKREAMRGKKIAIWGTGREGSAAATFLLAADPGANIVFLDERGAADLELDGRLFPVVGNVEILAEILETADVVVKSPGVSLYHEKLKTRQAKGLPVTSLLNLWFEENPAAFTVGVTGTKGKSTTSTLLGHVLNRLGKKTAVVGNIGVPITEERGEEEVAVIEVSSYQAADFDGLCDLGILTSLYPEHLNWHGSLERYYADKANLIRHSKVSLVHARALEILEAQGIPLPDASVFGTSGSFHVTAAGAFAASNLLGAVENGFLNRPHNWGNVAAVLAAVERLDLDPVAALSAMKDYRGLPHRQEEVGVKDGVLYVDDSISTTPQSALAALRVYGDRPVTLIAGGFDRGVDTEGFIASLAASKLCVVCLGQTGQKIFDGLRRAGRGEVFLASSMEEAVTIAQRETPQGGAILLSPGAPSFDMFRDYEDRAQAFRDAAGF